MQAKDIMTKKVISILDDASVMDAIKLLIGKKISGLPVVDVLGKIVGVVSEKDLLKVKNVKMAKAKKVKDYMTKNVISAKSNTTIDEIIKLFITRGIKRVPIVKNNKPIGIVSRHDVLKKF